jgi:hypothetical protein
MTDVFIFYFYKRQDYVFAIAALFSNIGQHKTFHVPTQQMCLLRGARWYNFTTLVSERVLICEIKQ